MDKLKDFIAFARARCHPQLTDAAANDLVDNYLQLRRAGSSRKVSATLRAWYLKFFLLTFSVFQ